MEDGFFKTGDIGRYDASAWLYIEGRINNLICVQGCKVLPRELEETIMLHPFVKDTAVIGNDKEVVACVIPKADTKLDENKLITYLLKKLYQQKYKINFSGLFQRDFLYKTGQHVLYLWRTFQRHHWEKSDETH